MISCTNSQPKKKKKEQYGSSTGCKYIVQLQTHLIKTSNKTIKKKSNEFINSGTAQT